MTSFVKQMHFGSLSGLSFVCSRTLAAVKSFVKLHQPLFFDLYQTQWHLRLRLRYSCYRSRSLWLLLVSPWFQSASLSSLSFKSFLMRPIFLLWPTFGLVHHSSNYASKEGFIFFRLSQFIIANFHHHRWYPSFVLETTQILNSLATAQHLHQEMTVILYCFLTFCYWTSSSHCLRTGSSYVLDA